MWRPKYYIREERPLSAQSGRSGRPTVPLGAGVAGAATQPVGKTFKPRNVPESPGKGLLAKVGPLSKGSPSSPRSSLETPLPLAGTTEIFNRALLGLDDGKSGILAAESTRFEPQNS